MANWYCGRLAVKRAAASINGDDKNATLDRLIEAASRRIDLETRRRFLPITQTLLYRWTQPQGGRSYILWLDEDLLTVSALLTKAQDSSPTTISASDFFLEPVNLGPPYNRIEIDLSSSSSFESGDTPQRSISVAGSWGYGNATRLAGTVASGLSSSSSATSMVVSDSSLIDVGDTLLIESEQLFMSNVTNAALDSIKIDGALTADKTETVTVDSSHGLNVGEVIMVDSEQMFIQSIVSNTLSVIRAFNGTILAAHANDVAVNVFRTFTVERGVNGTTAATHADATAISVQEPPFDIVELCVAETIAAYHQEQSGWGRTVGVGENQSELSGRALSDLRNRVIGSYKRTREATI